MHNLAIHDFDGEPRMRDAHIAEALGFDQPRDIRKLIKRHMADLLTFGNCATVAQIHEAAGRPGTEYWLNEEQALFLCTRSQAPGAVALTRAMVITFADWRNGRLAPAPRTPAQIDLPPDAATWARLIREARLLFGTDRARWLWAQSPLPQPPDPQAATCADTAQVIDFLRRCCVVTGDPGDYVTTRALLDAFAPWARPQGAVLSERRLSLLLRRLSQAWTCPETGRGFAEARRQSAGYRGLVLRAHAPQVTP